MERKCRFNNNLLWRELLDYYTRSERSVIFDESINATLFDNINSRLGQLGKEEKVGFHRQKTVTICSSSTWAFVSSCFVRL